MYESNPYHHHEYSVGVEETRVELVKLEECKVGFQIVTIFSDLSVDIRFKKGDVLWIVALDSLKLGGKRPPNLFHFAENVCWVLRH